MASSGTKSHEFETLLLIPNTSCNSNYNKSSIIIKISLYCISYSLTFLIFTLTLDAIFKLNQSPESPIVQLNSLSISKLTISNTKLATTCVVNLTFTNPILGFDNLYVERIESSLYYKENDDIFKISVDGFQLKTRNPKNVIIKFETTGYEGDQPIVEYPVLREMKQNLVINGTLRLSMKLGLAAAGEIAWVGNRKDVVITPYCLDLDVVMDSDTGTGFLIGGPRSFTVLMMLASD